MVIFTAWISPEFGWVQRASLEKAIEECYERFQAVDRFGLSIELAKGKVSEYKAKITAGDVSSDKYNHLRDGVSGQRWKRPDTAIDFALLNLAVAELATKNHDRETAWSYLLKATHYLDRLEKEERRKTGKRGDKRLIKQVSLTKKTPYAAEKFMLLELMRNDTSDSRWKKKSAAALKFYRDLNSFSTDIRNGTRTAKVEVSPGKVELIPVTGTKVNADSMTRCISEWICRYNELCTCYLAKSDDNNCKNCEHYSGIE